MACALWQQLLLLLFVGLFIGSTGSVTVTVDLGGPHKRFDGVGGVSGGGGGTRLLMDYAEPARSEILDFLFKPGFGATLQVLKVEVGCDGDTTQGAEQSHMRARDDASATAFDRGYENWLMVEAKKRNPLIHLSGLEWGVPGWVSEGSPVVDPPTQAEDTGVPVSTDECSTTEKVQQWTFDDGAPGQLCNANGQCLNVPACNEAAEIVLWAPSAPGTSCVSRCGCKKVSGQSCGIGPGKLDCYKNGFFNFTSGTPSTQNIIKIFNAISGKLLHEDQNRETLKLEPNCGAKCSEAEWRYDAETKLLKNRASGRCLGRWQNAPPPPPPPPPGPQPGHRATTATRENIDYLVKWVHGLKKFKNLTMDSIGVGYNEGGFSVPWMISAKKAFTQAGLSSMLTIGTDDCCGGQYRVASQMATNPELNASIDVLGAHCTGVQNGQSNPSEAVLALNKPLWNTEQHFGLPDPSPALCWQWGASLALAQTLNQQFVVSNQTSVQMWTPIYSWYEWLPYEGKGLMVANRPWDSTYNVTDTIWVAAHTTQFTERGWLYLVGASALLPAAVASQGKAGGGSYVTLVSPGCVKTGEVGERAAADAACDVTIVIETVGATAPVTLDFVLTGALAAAANTLQCWTTQEGKVFIRQQPVAVAVGGKVPTITVPPDNVWTLSTITTAAKGGGDGGAGKDQPQKPFPMPHTEDFESYGVDTLPKYFSDMHGAFSVQRADACGNGASRGSSGKCLQQQADSTPPLATHGRGAAAYSVVIGDTSWHNYSVAVRVMVKPATPNATAPPPPPGSTFFYIGNALTTGHTSPESTYHQPFLPAGGGAVLHVDTLGREWSVMSSCGASDKQQCSAKPAVVAAGTLPASSSGAGWMNVSLAISAGARAAHVVAIVDGASLVDKFVACRECYFGGPAVLGSGFHPAWFDDFAVTSV